MDNGYDSLSKAELVERLKLAEKSQRLLRRITLLVAIAVYVFIFKDELLALLVKLGAEVKADG